MVILNGVFCANFLSLRLIKKTLIEYKFKVSQDLYLFLNAATLVLVCLSQGHGMKTHPCSQSVSSSLMHIVGLKELKRDGITVGKEKSEDDIG